MRIIAARQGSGLPTPTARPLCSGARVLPSIPWVKSRRMTKECHGGTDAQPTPWAFPLDSGWTSTDEQQYSANNKPVQHQLLLPDPIITPSKVPHEPAKGFLLAMLPSLLLEAMELLTNSTPELMTTERLPLRRREAYCGANPVCLCCLPRPFFRLGHKSLAFSGPSANRKHHHAVKDAFPG
ncbi:uncharacterized protein EI97DRAFT_439747 [Westerdykella ornata]|uniref:Uncharacterized protein n=1 Tax=Westerdykella ornata TaxID=318751 RepID=A0A6A6JS53_WESOR|nr:uncharacterized protein EI97DRAFT_439747 [Westerdykella ornata]KAF2279392.1 hypothetical protein EI97DRAFT_439747 [Westerdykella ornata]